MNRVELVQALRTGGVPETRYDIEGARDCPWCDSCVYLRSTPSGWEVGFRERGTDEAYDTYAVEDEAVEGVLRIVQGWGHLGSGGADRADG